MVERVRSPQGRFAKAGIPEMQPVVNSLPLITKPEHQSKETFQNAIDRMKTIQELREPLNIWQDEVDIKVETGKLPYFFLLPLSDLHIGSEYTNYEFIEKALKFSKDNNVQMAHFGDLGDFFSPKIIPEAMMDTVANPDEQIKALRSFYEEYQDNILFSVSGNHDDWVRKASGVEPYRWLAQDLNIPLLNSGGVVNLDVNGIDYKILGYHAIGKFNSSFNLTHAGKRMLELQEDADLVISGHKHMFAAEKAQLRDKKVTVVSLGTTKNDDMYGKRSYGLGPKPQLGFPIIMFNGVEKNIELIEDMDVAQDVIQSLKQTHGK
jgi:predicted phosphodiesterase